MLVRLRLRRGQVEGTGDGDVQVLAAPLEHARELAHAAVGDGEGRAFVADGNRDERRARLPAALGRRGERAQERERLEVDPDQLDARLLARGGVPVDKLAVGDDEQDLEYLLAFPVDALLQHLVVEHGLLDRDRKRLLGAEADRVGELLRVVDARDLERTDADPVVRDAEPDALLRQLVALEELPQCLREPVRVAQLAADDDAGVDPLAGNLQQLGVAVVRDARGRELRGTDLEADELLRDAAPAAAAAAQLWERER